MSTSISDYTDVNALSLFDLSDRVALVTGGGTGIGLMIARGLASNGAKVYIGGRREHVLTTSAVEYKWQGKIIPYVLSIILLIIFYRALSIVFCL